jgi:histidinol-phosphate aminotransferase
VDIKRLIRKSVRTLEPYKAKEIACRVKLDANESPYSYPSLLKETMRIKTNRYPDPEGKALKREASKKWKVPVRNILLSNGSDELIYYLVTAFGGPVLYPTPTFSMYGIISTALGEKTIPVPLTDDFDIDIRKTEAKIKRYKPHLIFLSSPNNPTGNCFSEEKLLKILEMSSGVVVVDEAYQPFSEKNHLPLLKKYRNLAIMRTLSKIGFASLRVGFLISHPEVTEVVNRVRLPFNVNSLSQAVATEVFRNYDNIEKDIEKLKRERDRLYRRLRQLKGIEVFPSEANFILFRVKGAKTLHRRLLKEGVLIRDITSQIKNCLRVTVGTEEENEIFITTLARLLK